MPATTVTTKNGGTIAIGLTPTPGQVRANAWREAEELARSITGYDKASVIYGKPDLEVLSEVLRLINPPPSAPGTSNMQTTDLTLARAMVQQLIARKGARQLAGATYRSKK